MDTYWHRHKDLLLKSDLPLLSKRYDLATLCHFKIVHDLCSSPNPFQPHPPTKSPEPQLLCPGSPFLPSDLVPEIILSIWPYTWELSPGGNCPVQVCHPSRWLFIPISSCVIIVCFVLFCLILFSLPYSLLRFSHFSVCPHLYFVWCIWASPECIVCHSYTPCTLRACCSQSKFRILKIRESSARALFLYNCTPNMSRSAYASVSVT